MDLYEELIALTYGVRHVRTLEGVEFFHLPIGSPITPEMYEAVKAQHLAQHEAHWKAIGKANQWQSHGHPQALHQLDRSLGTAAEAAKSAAAYAKNPAATQLKHLPSDHALNHPANLLPGNATPVGQASQDVKGVTDLAPHLNSATSVVDSNTGETYSVHAPTLNGPNKFQVQDQTYGVPKGSRLIQPIGINNVKLVITPDDTVHAFTEKGEVTVPTDVQQAFASVMPPGFKGDAQFKVAQFLEKAAVSPEEKKAIQDTHTVKQAARDAGNQAVYEHQVAHAAEQAATPPSKPGEPGKPTDYAPKPQSDGAGLGKHAIVTGALMHAEPGTHVVDEHGETQFIKNVDGSWKHVHFGVDVPEHDVQKLVDAKELSIKQDTPALAHDFKAMSKEQWLQFLHEAPVNSSFEMPNGHTITKGKDQSWDGMPSDKMGPLRIVVGHYTPGPDPQGVHGPKPDGTPQTPGIHNPNDPNNDTSLLGNPLPKPEETPAEPDAGTPSASAAPAAAPAAAASTAAPSAEPAAAEPGAPAAKTAAELKPGDHLPEGVVASVSPSSTFPGRVNVTLHTPKGEKQTFIWPQDKSVHVGTGKVAQDLKPGDATVHGVVDHVEKHPEDPNLQVVHAKSENDAVKPVEVAKHEYIPSHTPEQLKKADKTAADEAKKAEQEAAKNPEKAAETAAAAGPQVGKYITDPAHVDALPVGAKVAVVHTESGNETTYEKFGQNSYVTPGGTTFSANHIKSYAHESGSQGLVYKAAPPEKPAETPKPVATPEPKVANPNAEVKHNPGDTMTMAKVNALPKGHTLVHNPDFFGDKFTYTTTGTGHLVDHNSGNTIGTEKIAAQVQAGHVKYHSGPEGAKPEAAAPSAPEPLKAPNEAAAAKAETKVAEPEAPKIPKKGDKVGTYLGFDVMKARADRRQTLENAPTNSVVQKAASGTGGQMDYKKGEDGLWHAQGTVPTKGVTAQALSGYSNLYWVSHPGAEGAKAESVVSGEDHGTGQPAGGPDAGATSGIPEAPGTNAGGAGGTSGGSGAGGLASGAVSPEPKGLIVDGKPVKTVAEFADTKRGEAIRAAGGSTPKMYELHPDEAQVFHDAISKTKDGNKYAAAVYVYSPQEYKDMRLFMSEDGTAGVALHGDEIVSVFSQKTGSAVGPHLTAHAIEQGGRRADAFDTVLPHIYAQEGLVPVARIKWDDSQAPDGWDKSTFAKYNGGEPDVVFLAYQPDRVGSAYTPGEGKYVASYEDGLKAAQDVVAGKTEAPAEGEGLTLWGGGPTFQHSHVQEAHDALKAKGGFQPAYAFKDIPNNPLGGHLDALKTAAAEKYPGMQIKGAVQKLLKDALGSNDATSTAADDAVKIGIGNHENPKPTIQGFDGGKFTKDEIQQAIQALEGSTSKLTKNILNNAGSPLGGLNPNSIVGFNKDKTVTKQKFIDHLKGLVGTPATPTPEATPEPATVPEAPPAAPAAPKFRPPKEDTSGLGTVGTPLEKETRYKAPPAPPTQVAEPDSPDTGPKPGDVMYLQDIHDMPVGDQIQYGDGIKVTKTGPNEVTSVASGETYPIDGNWVSSHAASGHWKYVGSTQITPEVEQQHATEAHAAEVLVPGQKYPPSEFEDAGVGSVATIYSNEGANLGNVEKKHNGLFESSNGTQLTPEMLQHVHIEWQKYTPKDAAKFDGITHPKTAAEFDSLPHKTALLVTQGSNTYDAQKTNDDNKWFIQGLGMYTGEQMADQLNYAGTTIIVAHNPKDNGKELTAEQAKALSDGSKVFLDYGNGRILTRTDNYWNTPAGQYVSMSTFENALNEGGKAYAVHTVVPDDATAAEKAGALGKGTIVQHKDGSYLTKRSIYSWSHYSPSGAPLLIASNDEVKAMVASGDAQILHEVQSGTETPTLAAGKWQGYSADKAHMHVLPDGTGIYVASTGTTKKLTAAAVIKNWEAGMNNYVGNPTEHVPPAIAAKAPSSTPMVKKAPVPAITSADLPDGTYHLKTSTGDILTIENGTVFKNGETLGDLQKLKLPFSKGQIVNSHGISYVPKGYTGAVSMYDNPTTIPALLEVQKHLEDNVLGHSTAASIGSFAAPFTALGFPLNLKTALAKYNATAAPDMKVPNSYWGFQDASEAGRQAFAQMIHDDIAAILSNVNTEVPKGNTTGLFEWGPNGEAKYPLAIASLPLHGTFNTSPTVFSDQVKAATAALHAEKIFYTVGMSKYDKHDWLEALKKGNFAKMYSIESKNAIAHNKSHPTGYLHPGYPGNSETNHVIWGAAVDGEIPAGITVAGQWTPAGIPASKAELDNYLIAAQMQHPEHLSFAEKRDWVTWHQAGEKANVDQLSAAAALRAANGEPQKTPTPVWTDNVQPAKGYDVWFDNGPFPTYNDLNGAPNASYKQYLEDNKNDPQLSASLAASPNYGHYQNLDDFIFQNTQPHVFLAFLNEHFTRLKTEWQIEEAKPKYHITHPIEEGQHPTFHVEDQHGHEYLFKPIEGNKDYRAEIEVAALKLGSLFGFNYPVATIGEVEGKKGMIQGWIPNVGTLNQPEGQIEVQSMSPEQLGQIAADHVLDWALDNDDGHAENLMLGPDGAITGIDKGRAFVAYGHWPGLAADNSMNTQSTVMFSKLAAAIKDGSLKPEQINGAYLGALRAAKKIQKPGNDDAATEILQEGLKNRTNFSLGGPTSAAGIVQAFLDRKHAIVDDIQKMWEKLYAAAGLEMPQPPAKALGEEHTSGYHEADLSEKLAEKKVWGLSVIHANPLISNGESLLWQEKGADGNTYTHGKFQVNIAAQQAALAWLTSKAGGQQVAVNLADFPDFTALHKVLTTTAHDISDNVEHPEAWSAEQWQQAMDVKTQLQNDLNHAASLPTSAGQGGETYTFPSGRVIDGSALYQYRAALNHYMNMVGALETAKKDGLKTNKNDFKKFIAIASPAQPKTYINEAKGEKYVQLTDGTFVTNKGTIVPASQLPDDAAKGEGGWIAINHTADNSSGITVTKESAGDLTGSLGEGGAKTQHDQFGELGHPGDQYVVHLPTGEFIRYRNTSHTDTVTSQQGQIRFRLAGSDPEASLSRVEAALQQMGLDMAGATQDNIESVYWRQMFYRAVNSDHATLPAKVKTAVDQLLALKTTVANEFGLPYGLTNPQLVDAVAASKSIGDPEKFWHDLGVAAFGEKEVKAFIGSDQHLPVYQHHDFSDPTKTTGHAFWKRLDVNAEKIKDKQTLLGQGNSNKDQSVNNLIKSGNSISTEERLRMLGFFKNGASSSKDQHTGGANFVFTRVAKPGSQVETYGDIYGDHVVYWSPEVLKFTGTFSFPRDQYGNIEWASTPGDPYENVKHAPFDPMKALNFSGNGNETMIPFDMALLDFMEILIYNSPTEREAAIQKFKSFGLHELRGVPIEQRIIMRQDLTAAMAIVKAAWAKEKWQ